MMGISPAEADRLTLWQYTALRWEWNERHKSPDELEAVEPPDIEMVKARQRELYDLGIAGTRH
jgi:hypothetical protein